MAFSSCSTAPWRRFASSARYSATGRPVHGAGAGEASRCAWRARRARWKAASKRGGNGAWNGVWGWRKSSENTWKNWVGHGWWWLVLEFSRLMMRHRTKRSWFTQLKVADIAKAVRFTGKTPSVVNKILPLTISTSTTIVWSRLTSIKHKILKTSECIWPMDSTVFIFHHIPSASRVVRATSTWRDVKGDFIRPFTATRRRLFQNLQRTTRSAQPKQVATFLGMTAGSKEKGFENGTWFGLCNVLHHDLRTNLTRLKKA